MYTRVKSIDFIPAFVAARMSSTVIADNTSTPTEIHKAGLFDDGYYLSADEQSGFIISETGELKGVFSLERGRGAALVEAAIASGAKHLDCFDGPLVDLYSRAGFEETSRVANWDEGGPDVVFMAIAANTTNV